ncbi:hypothetical protein PtrV1_13871 [Pyrenophora tritici-repentis]|nr:hypothetical protein PtrV1_13871 [Pyrenophora tritici-repentis]
MASDSPHDSDFQIANPPGGVDTKDTSQEVCGSNHDAGETFHSSLDVSLVPWLPAEAQFPCLPSGTSSSLSEYHNDRTELPNDSHSYQSAPIPVTGIPFHGSGGFSFAHPDEMIVETPSFVHLHNTPPAGFTSSVFKSPTVAAYLPPTAESRAKDESSNFLEQPQERAFPQSQTFLTTTPRLTVQSEGLSEQANKEELFKKTGITPLIHKRLMSQAFTDFITTFKQPSVLEACMPGNPFTIPLAVSDVAKLSACVAHWLVGLNLGPEVPCGMVAPKVLGIIATDNVAIALEHDFCDFMNLIQTNSFVQKAEEKGYLPRGTSITKEILSPSLLEFAHTQGYSWLV